MGYVIVGDAGKYKGCLVLALKGNWTREQAEQRLKELLASDDAMDKRVYEGHTNLRVASTDPKEEWWNDSVLVR